MDGGLGAWSASRSGIEDRRMPRKPRPPATYLTRRRWTIAEARDALAALHTSGLSPNAFAVRHGIDGQRLYYWRRRLAGEHQGVASVPEFVELRSRGSEPVEVVLRSGRVLRVAESIDPAVLIRLVGALEQTEPC